MENGEGFIITSQMIYTQLLQIQQDINLVKERLERLSFDRQDHENRIRQLESVKVGDKVDDHEGRLRSLERKVLLIAGTASAVVSALVQLGSMFMH